MRKPALFALSVSLLAAVVAVRAQEQTNYTKYYVFDGTTLQVADDFSSYRTDRQWQVWLYEEGVHIPHYTAGLQYSRWGLIQGRSAESVKRQLKAAQSFEKAYLNFFGPGTWGRYTFFSALGPIAITDQAVEKNPAALEERYQLDELYDRVNKLIVCVQPSLENNESLGRTSSIKEYFDQIRDALQQVSKLYSQLAHPNPQVYFIRTKDRQSSCTGGEQRAEDYRNLAKREVTNKHRLDVPPRGSRQRWNHPRRSYAVRTRRFRSTDLVGW